MARARKVDEVHEVDPTEDGSRKTQILQAANTCFTQLGISRTSVQDVARTAKVSRGTIYRYFGDRDTLIEAAVEFGGQQYYRKATEAMAKAATLVDQVGAMAEVVAKTKLDHRAHNRLMANDAELMRHLITDGDSNIRRTSDILKPYVQAAKVRGEIGKNVDVSASSEWLARVIHSLFTVTTAISFDMSKPKTVRAFIETFAIKGLR